VIKIKNKYKTKSSKDEITDRIKIAYTLLNNFIVINKKNNIIIIRKRDIFNFDYTKKIEVKMKIYIEDGQVIIKSELVSYFEIISAFMFYIILFIFFLLNGFYFLLFIISTLIFIIIIYKRKYYEIEKEVNNFRSKCLYE
jgi:hypothetical protein